MNRWQPEELKALGKAYQVLVVDKGYPYGSINACAKVISENWATFRPQTSPQARSTKAFKEKLGALAKQGQGELLPDVPPLILCAPPPLVSALY